MTWSRSVSDQESASNRQCPLINRHVRVDVMAQVESSGPAGLERRVKNPGPGTMLGRDHLEGEGPRFVGASNGRNVHRT